ncbi:hypothetical protein [Hellea balneolensis]|uniref:hypothetical protein n=1 Tax=Hellea balneolensis TaxID=287478 RepID=UPI0004178EAA|nr:hypothetical protein [Hellea balneolensis]
MTKLKTKTLFKTAAIATLITGFANSASALEVTNPLLAPGAAVELFDGPTLSETTYNSPIIEASAKIAVARLDGGRLIPTPYGEEVDWEMLDKRMSADIELMNAGDYIKYIPEIAYPGQDTDNKIDEVRITAASEGYPYVLIYGVGPDATWASFGGKALRETGLSVKDGCDSWQKAKAKALLVNAFTGEVLGAATAENVEFNIGELADNVGDLVKSLSEV